MSRMPKFHGCSMSISHGFTGYRPWFTTVNICLFPGKHARLPDGTEHAKLCFIIKTQTEVEVGSQPTTEYEHNTKHTPQFRTMSEPFSCCGDVLVCEMRRTVDRNLMCFNDLEHTNYPTNRQPPQHLAISFIILVFTFYHLFKLAPLRPS